MNGRGGPITRWHQDYVRPANWHLLLLTLLHCFCFFNELLSSLASSQRGHSIKRHHSLSIAGRTVINSPSSIATRQPFFFQKFKNLLKNTDNFMKFWTNIDCYFNYILTKFHWNRINNSVLNWSNMEVTVRWSILSKALFFKNSKTY